MIAVIAVLIGLLIPALAKSREAARATVCLSNLRQCAIVCAQYADENKGRSPAIGQPYSSWPTWPLVVQASTGHTGDTPDELYSEASVLVCPTIARAYSQQQMVRTYAMNATGHAGQPGDPDNYDDAANPAFLHMDCVALPGNTPFLMDSDVPPVTTTDPPPPSRTAAMIDFRQVVQVQTRLGWFHNQGFNGAMFDLSARRQQAVDPMWCQPLP